MEKTRKYTVLGQQLELKNYICSKDGGEYKLKPEKISLELSICPTSFCNARCPFCVAAAGRENESKLDIKKLETGLRKLKSEELVRGISITGGEPTLDMGLLNEIINLCFEVFGNSMELCFHTNGYGLKEVNKIEKLKYVESIHWSRHHFDDDINKMLFGGAKVPTNKELKEIVDSITYKDIFVFNCLLMKDYIGTTEMVHRFLEFCSEVGVPKAGFVTTMPINDFAKSQRVEYSKVISENDPKMLFTRQFQDYEMCKCQDGVYCTKNGSLVEFYGRTTCPGDCDYVRGFVYGADNILRTGFSATSKEIKY